jgi:hypothetical protein
MRRFLKGFRTHHRYSRGESQGCIFKIWEEMVLYVYLLLRVIFVLGESDLVILLMGFVFQCGLFCWFF